MEIEVPQIGSTENNHSTKTKCEDQTTKRSSTRIRLVRALKQNWINIVEWWEKHSHDSWWGEIICCLLSQASLIILAVVLGQYHNKPLSAWNNIVTINTFVQILLTAITAALAYSTSNGISQLKWIWFATDKRTAYDFNRFDDASRGPCGSQKLLVSFRRYGRLPSSGALVICCLAMAGPFSQEVVHYTEKQTSLHRRGVAQTPRSTFFDIKQYNLSAIVPLRAAFYTAAQVSPSANSIEPTKPHCSTGNCFWQPYKTTGVCAYTTDLSSLVAINCPERIHGPCSAHMYGTCIAPQSKCQLSLPLSDGSWLNSSGWTSILHNNKGTGRSPGSFSNYVVLWQRVDHRHNLDDDYGAMIINLRACVQTLNTSVEHGSSRTEVIDTYKHFVLSRPTRAGKHLWAATPPGSSEEFYVSLAALAILTSTIDEFWKGSNLYANAILEEWIDIAPYGSKGLEAMASNIATALSNYFREHPKYSTQFEGTALIRAAYVEVRWAWLSMLVFIVLSGNLFLVLVIRANGKTHNPLWKSSNIALLRALNTEKRPRKLVGLTKDYDMAKDAKDVYMKLHVDKDTRIHRLELDVAE